MITFLSISLNMCLGCSKKPSHRDDSFEYPQHMFCLRNKKNNFQSHTLNWGPEFIVHKGSYMCECSCIIEFIRQVEKKRLNVSLAIKC